MARRKKTTTAKEPVNPAPYDFQTTFRDAMTTIAERHAWAMHALQKIPIIVSENYPTCTDGAKIFLNPKQAETWQSGPWTHEHLAAVILHELYHIWKEHIPRFKTWGEQHHKRANYAADYALNLHVVLNLGFILPDGCLLDQKYAGMSMETIFYMLANDPNATNPDTAQRYGGKRKGMDGLDQDLAQGSEGLPAPASAEEIERSVYGIAEGVLEGMSGGNGRPDAGDYDRALAVLSGGEMVPWEQRLLDWADCAANSGSCWASPDRRFVAQGLYLPGKRAPEQSVEHLVLAIDTSGSMDGKAVLAVGAVAQDILDTGLFKQVTVLHFDDYIRRQESFAKGDTIELPLDGCGGTSIAPVMAWLAKHQPTAAIVLTDMMFAPPTLNPGVPICWARYGAFRWPTAATQWSGNVRVQVG